jgi:hypothetical protein
MGRLHSTSRSPAKQRTRVAGSPQSAVRVRSQRVPVTVCHHRHAVSADDLLLRPVRLAALLSVAIMDTPHETDFDDLCALAGPR